MSEQRIHEARQEARYDALIFVFVAIALLVGLAIASRAAEWELLGYHWKVWLLLCLPELGLAAALALSSLLADYRASHRVLQVFIGVVVIGNAVGLVVLVAGLVTRARQTSPARSC